MMVFDGKLKDVLQELYTHYMNCDLSLLTAQDKAELEEVKQIIWKCGSDLTLGEIEHELYLHKRAVYVLEEKLKEALIEEGKIRKGSKVRRINFDDGYDHDYDDFKIVFVHGQYALLDITFNEIEEDHMFSSVDEIRQLMLNDECKWEVVAI